MEILKVILKLGVGIFKNIYISIGKNKREDQRHPALTIWKTIYGIFL